MIAEEHTDGVTRAILILQLSSLDDLAALSSPITSAATRTQSHLLIAIFTSIFDNVSQVASWDAVQRLLTYVYIQATKVSQEQNKILMSVDVVLQPVQGYAHEISQGDWDIVFYANRTEGLPIPHGWLSLPSVHFRDDISVSSEIHINRKFSEDGPAGYPVVALGGTFDHLHAGHKILLSLAAWISQEKVIVGVTDDALLMKKVHRELLESIDTRLEAVHNFLRMFRPGLIYDVVPITDVYGPTGWDPNIQALVVSKETLTGAESITHLRANKSLPPLKIFVIDVISARSAILETEDPNLLKNAKMSSTLIRQWIHDQQAEVRPKWNHESA